MLFTILILNCFMTGVLIKRSHSIYLQRISRENQWVDFYVIRTAVMKIVNFNTNSYNIKLKSIMYCLHNH